MPQTITSLDLVKRFETERFNSSRGEIGKNTLLCPFCGRILSQIAVIGERFICTHCEEEYMVVG